jgi:hypothetical protein
MKISKRAAKMALLATAALATAYTVTPSRLTAASNTATAMVQNGALNAAFRQSMQLECVIWRKIYPRQYLAELL